MVVISELIHNNGWNQVKASEVLGITQPRASSLINGQVSKFSMDKLYGYLTLCGYNFELSLNDGVSTITTEVA